MNICWNFHVFIQFMSSLLISNFLDGFLFHLDHPIKRLFSNCTTYLPLLSIFERPIMMKVVLKFSEIQIRTSPPDQNYDSDKSNY